MEIKLAEHNASIPLFITNDNNVNTEITVSDQQYGVDNYLYNNCFCVSKISNKLFILEDVGYYDTNTPATCKLTLKTSDSEKEFDVFRVCEFASIQNDSNYNYYNNLYTNRLSATKVIFISPNTQTLKLPFFMKWVNRYPPCDEVITDKTIDFYNQTPNGKYKSLTVSLSESINDNEYSIGENFLTFQNLSIDFAKITATYSVTCNNSGNFKGRLINIKGPTTHCGVGEYTVSDNYWGYYYIIQVPESNIMFIRMTGNTIIEDSTRKNNRGFHNNYPDKKSHYITYLDNAPIVSCNSTELNGKTFIFNNQVYGNSNFNYVDIFIPEFYSIKSINDITFETVNPQVVHNSIDGQSYYKLNYINNIETIKIILN